MATLTPLVSIVAGHCRTYLRLPVTVGADEATGELAFTFEPPLTAAEQATFRGIVAISRGNLDLTPAEWLTIEDDLAALRTFRQQTQAQFMALTATQRDRALFDVVNAQTNVLRALLRD